MLPRYNVLDPYDQHQGGTGLKTRTLRKLALLLALVTAFLVSAGAANAQQTSAQFVIGSGSDTTWYMMHALGDLYSQAPGCNQLFSPQPLNGTCPNSASENPADSENYFHDTIVQRMFIGSGGGINQMCKQGLANVSAVDFARSSRVPLPASAGGSDCTGLHFVGFARDGISWECFPGKTGAGCKPLVAGTNSLTIAQLKNVFVNCSVTNWNQIGGSSKAIHVYVAQANSGSGVTWAANLDVQLAAGQALTQCVDNPSNPGQPGSNVSPENTNTLIHTNGDEANAIFPYSVGVYKRTYHSLKGSDGSSLGRINGVTPTNPNIQSGDFPVSRFLFNVYCAGDPANANKCGTTDTAQEWTTNFVGENGFLCKPLADHRNTSGHLILDPLTGKPYRKAALHGQPQGLIPSTILQQGFVPLKKQSDDSFCKTFTT
jgi:ABC-type phosphate transport system substrate-binding protein